MILEKKHLHEMPCDETGTVFYVEASEIELTPGYFPQRLFVAEDVGNGQDLICHGWATDETMYYVQPNSGLELHVVND